MGMTLKFFTDRDFLLTTLTGDLDDQNFLEHETVHVGATEGMCDLKELADLRSVTSVSSLSVPATVRCSMMEHAKPQSMLAILVPPESQLLFGMARVYQAFAEERRAAAEVFTDLNTALEWLADDSSEFELLVDFVESSSQGAVDGQTERELSGRQA